MKILESRFCRVEDLVEDLVPGLQSLVFRAGDGAAYRGRLATLAAYPAAPFGEETLLDRALGLALAPEDAPARAPIQHLSLALDLRGNAGDNPPPPGERVLARLALARILESPDASEADKDAAAAALGQLNLPRLGPRVLAGLQFLVGIRHDAAQRVKVASLDESGLACLDKIPPEAQCWIRLRHGPVLALEIAARARQHSLRPGGALSITSDLGDWVLRFNPGVRTGSARQVDLLLEVDRKLRFRPEGFAVVATPEQGGANWYIATLDSGGRGALKGLPPGAYHLALGLAPKPTTGANLQTDLAAKSRIRVEAGRPRLTVDASDPALANSRCVCVWQSSARGPAVFVGETSVRGASAEEGWRGRAEATFAPPRFATPDRGGGEAVRVRGAVRTRGAAPAGRPVSAAQLSCLVLL